MRFARRQGGRLLHHCAPAQPVKNTLRPASTRSSTRCCSADGGASSSYRLGSWQGQCWRCTLSIEPPLLMDPAGPQLISIILLTSCWGRPSGGFEVYNLGIQGSVLRDRGQPAGRCPASRRARPPNCLHSGFRGTGQRFTVTVGLPAGQCRASRRSRPRCRRSRRCTRSPRGPGWTRTHGCRRRSGSSPCASRRPPPAHQITRWAVAEAVLCQCPLGIWLLNRCIQGHRFTNSACCKCGPETP